VNRFIEGEQGMVDKDMANTMADNGMANNGGMADSGEPIKGQLTLVCVQPRIWEIFS
jgi:hypothetical protein